MIGNFRKGFTLVELLVVMAIIGLLVAISVPALNLAKFKAKEGALKMKLNTISTALETFNGDQGFYPPSTMLTYAVYDVNTDGVTNTNDIADRDSSFYDTGSHLLARALIGADGLGYQENGYYATNTTTGRPIDSNGQSTTRSNYLDAEGFMIETLNNQADPQKEIKGMDGTEVAKNLGITLTSEAQKAWDNPNPVIRDDLTRYSMPILYFKANKRNYIAATADNTGIYNYFDNVLFTGPTGMTLEYDISSQYLNTSLSNFAYYTWDTNTQYETSTCRPSNKESFILITAGKDGLYGTADDICNFDFKTGKNLQ